MAPARGAGERSGPRQLPVQPPSVGPAGTRAATSSEQAARAACRAPNSARTGPERCRSAHPRTSRRAASPQWRPSTACARALSTSSSSSSRRHRRVTQGGGGECIEFGDLLAEHELVGTDGKLDKQHTPIGKSLANELCGTECFAVEPRSGVRVGDEDMGAQAERSLTGHAVLRLASSNPAVSAAATSRAKSSASLRTAAAPCGVSS